MTNMTVHTYSGSRLFRVGGLPNRYSTTHVNLQLCYSHFMLIELVWLIHSILLNLCMYSITNEKLSLSENQNKNNLMVNLKFRNFVLLYNIDIDFAISIDNA